MALIVRRAERLADMKVAIGAVRNHCLARPEAELNAVELYRNDVRLERHQAGDAADVGSVAHNPFILSVETLLP